MKLIKPYLLLLFSLCLVSCEEVIDLELNNAPPKLVIEASINYNIDPNITSFPTVILSKTAPFFDNQTPEVTNAVVSISDPFNNYPLIHTGNGKYVGNFHVQPNREYTLEVIYENELYTATTSLVKTAPLLYVEQTNDAGFSGNSIELKAFFQDPPNEENFYFFEGLSEKDNAYSATSDEFFDGNLFFGFYSSEDIEPGDIITFNLYGINQQTYQYLFTLLQQTEAPQGPFATQPATVRGNITNTTNPSNFPLGYFRISEVSTLHYTVQ